MDYIILDGRGGGTGAAPLIFRDNISVPTIPALARARAPPRQGLGIAAGHAHRHRRPAHAGRLRQGHGPRRRRHRGLELRHPGHRLPGHARLPHQQLPGGDRDAEGAPARAPAEVDLRGEAPGALPASSATELMRVMARAPADTTHLSQFSRVRRPHDLEARRGLSDRRRLRRRGAALRPFETWKRA